MGVAGLLFIVLILGLILYFTGFFDNEEKIKPITKIKTKEIAPEVVFDEKQIDKNELNKKLTLLTKKEIMDKEELEAEEERIAEEKRKKEEEYKKELEEKKKQEELKLANQLAKIQAEKDQLLKQQEEVKKTTRRVFETSRKSKRRA